MDVTGVWRISVITKDWQEAVSANGFQNSIHNGFPF